MSAFLNCFLISASLEKQRPTVNNQSQSRNPIKPIPTRAKAVRVGYPGQGAGTTSQCKTKAKSCAISALRQATRQRLLAKSAIKEVATEKENQHHGPCEEQCRRGNKPYPAGPGRGVIAKDVVPADESREPADADCYGIPCQAQRCPRECEDRSPVSPGMNVQRYPVPKQSNCRNKRDVIPPARQVAEPESAGQRQGSV